jgi:hypothetical protein
MALDCITDVQNIGASACKQFPQALESIIKTPLDFTITAEDAADVANWQDAVVLSAAERIHVFPLAYDFENLSEEATRASSNLGKEVTIRLGQYRFRLLFRENLEIHKAMYSHLGSAGRVFLIDVNKKLIGTSDDGGVTLKGFLLDSFTPEKIQFGDGSTPSLSPVYMALTNNEELDVNGQQMRFSTQLIALKPLVDVVLALDSSVTPTATGFKFTVKSIYDNVGVTGLLLADIVETMGGTLSSVTDNGDGSYTVVGVGMTTGTIALRAAALLTVQAYEGSNTLTVTIV